MGADAFTVGQLIASLGLDMTQFQAGITAAQGEMKAADAAMKSASARMSASLAKVGKSMVSVGKKMNKFITLPLLALGAISGKSFADFEASMSKIEGLVGVAAEEVARLTDEVLKMAPAVGRGPEELADALFFIESAGQRGAEALATLNLSAKASVAGLGETKTIADLVTSAMNAYGSENLNAAMATDILVASVREGKIEADELAGSLGIVLPIASEMGVAFNQVGAAFAGMTRTGTPAAVAATQLKAVMSTLLKPTDDAKRSLEGMGLSASGLRKQIKEEGLIATLETLRLTTNQYGEEAMSKVFPNIRALMGVLDLMGANMEQNIAISKRMEDTTGSLNMAYLAAEQTLRHKWNKAIVQVKTALVTFGKAMKSAVVPIIESFTEKIKAVTTWFNKLTEEQKQTTIKILALTAALGPLLLIVGKLFMAISANPIGVLLVALTAATIATVSFVKANKSLFRTYDAVNNATKAAEKEYMKQSLTVRTLVRAIEDENRSNESRIKAINKLKEIMPDYNASLTDEGVLINHNVGVIEKYLTALRNKIKLQMFEERYTAALKEQARVEEKLIGAYAKMGRGLVGRNIATQQAKLLEQRLQRATEAVEELDTAYAELAQTTGLLDETVVVPTPAIGTGGSGSGGAGETKEIVDVEAVKARLEQMAALRLQLTEEMMAAEVAAIKDGYQRTLAEEELNYFNRIAILQKQRNEFPELAAQIDNLIEQEQMNHDQTMVKLAIQQVADLKEIQDAATATELAAFQLKLQEITTSTQMWVTAGQTMQDVFNGIGAAVGVANNQMAQWTTYIGRILGSAGKLIGVIKKITAAKAIAAQTDAIASGAAIPFPGNLLAIAASVAAVVGALAAVPKFSEGGIVSGPTMAMMGEYAGARSNPEVIAPLDKLKKMLSPSMSVIPAEIELRARGDDLYAVLKLNEAKRNSY